MLRVAATALLANLLALSACTKAPSETPAASVARPSILLVTLDTTRADAIGPDSTKVETPSFDAIAGRGRRFRQAYATSPQTLPSHASMMTGLYPAAHGIHENARYLPRDTTLLAERLRKEGYRTAAFVSAYPLAAQFGLARGFEVYDDDMGNGRSERSARETTDRALSYLEKADARPLFLWVHFFEPHHPYEPPEPFRSRYSGNPYLGEIAAMDQELGRLVKGVEDRIGQPVAIVIAGDHGEGLGDHGEAQHGNLLYQGVMHVPLVLAGPGVEPGVEEAPVSIRRIYHTILDWAGLESKNSLRQDGPEVVLGEAMKPFLQYGWQPQIMAVEGNLKVIHAGKIEVYDVITDSSEVRDLAGETNLSRQVRQALREYPIPAPGGGATSKTLSDEERRRLASLGYVTSDTKPVIRANAPRPRDMAHLFDTLDKASGLFVREQYAQVIPLFEKILSVDPYNLGTALQLAAAYSALGRDERALAAFRNAVAIAPDSADVRHYLALHHIRAGRWEQAVPLLERVLAETPNRLPAIEALARLRERQGRFEEALTLWSKAHGMRTPVPAELIRMGELAMRVGNTPLALQSFEKARNLQGPKFAHDLELGVLYLDAGRLDQARDALDRVPPSHPGYPMVLFKRAQVSVLLGEPDRAARIEAARQRADATTRELIARERLFQGL